MPNLTETNGAEFGNPETRIAPIPVIDDSINYVTIGQGRLTNEFTEKPLINAIVKAMLTPIQESEDVASQLRSDRWISTAVGKQLDGCGYIVGETRQGRSDDTYRTAILFRVFVNISNATPEDLIHGLRYLTSPDDIQYIEQFPATAMLFSDGPNIQDNIQSVMQDLAPAAIATIPVMVSFARKSPFRFGKENNPGELFVNSDTSYLQANGSDIQVTMQGASGSRLGGIIPAELDVGGFGLDVGGSWLVINSPNFDTVLESGYHLTGVYQ